LSVGASLPHIVVGLSWLRAHPGWAARVCALQARLI